MKQTVLAQFDLVWLPLTGLVLFVVCFCLFVFWTYKKANEHSYLEAARIPLDGMNEGESNVGR